MKKSIYLLSILFCFLSLFETKAQESSDYFAGKWNAVIMGTPNGDAKMLLNLVRVDDKLTGTIMVSETDTTSIGINSIEENENAISLFFNAAGYDVSLFLEKKDEDNMTGNLVGMFSASAQRIKPE